MEDQNKKWMSNAKNIGCTFAAFFASRPGLCNWVTLVSPESFEIPKDASILSLQFPGMSKHQVSLWALDNDFFVEPIGDGNIGLRKMIGKHVAWVQYFGPDSHVKTRQTPIPELMLCVKRPALSYVRVGFKGILHLAHASVKYISQTKAHKLWHTSHYQTEKSLGHKPTLKEAAKTTYHV